MTKIFISYRRQDTKQIAGRIFDRLEAKFGKPHVFMDIDSIPFGVDFHDFLSRQVARAETVLALIGHGWAEARDEAGNRRLDNPNDFVRIEIESALERGIPIGAVLIDGAAMPRAEQLPETMRALTRRNAAFLDSGRDFNTHMNRLIGDLEKHLNGGVAADRQRPKAQRVSAEDRYRAEGRIEIDAPFVVSEHGRWLLPGAGKTEWFKDFENGPDMVVVPAGTFMMGSPEDEEERDDREGPQHQVTIPRPFAVGRYPVTNAEWAVFCEKSGRDKHDIAAGKGRHPVANVSWDDAKAYIDWLNDYIGGGQYRLPSEAEWEYCCRAGTQTRYSFGDEFRKDRANNGSGTSEVGSYPANDFGLYDMHGNVWEWCEDVWHGTYDDAPDDGSAWLSGGGSSLRVFRGGSWDYDPWYLRSACRYRLYSVSRDGSGGFRLSRTLNLNP